MTLLSDYIGAHAVTEVDKWDGKQRVITKVSCPAVVTEYNKNMGGVDLLHPLIALYRNKIRSKKWYHRLVFHFLDMSIVTALCTLSKTYNVKSVECKRGRPSSTIAGEYKEKKRKGPTAPIPEPGVPGCHRPLDDYG